MTRTSRARPTRLFWGLTIGSLALFGVGTNVQAGWLIVLTALLVGTVMAGAVLPRVALRGIEVARAAPAEAFAGRPVEVSLTVRNAGRSMRGLILAGDAFLGEASVVVDRLGPGESRTYASERAGGRRGLHTGGPCVLLTGAPFGIVHVTRAVEIDTRTLVFPRVVDVTAVALPGRTADAVAATRRAPAGDVAGVREYRAGDPLRFVHWRTSARRGSLVVREHEEDAGADLAVVADTSVGGNVLDAIACVCCSYALAALANGRRVRLCWAQDGAARSIDADGRRAVLEWGALLQAPGGAALPKVLAQAAGVEAVLAAFGASAADEARALGSLAEAGTSVASVVVSDGPDSVSAEATRVRDALAASGVRAVAVPGSEDLARWMPHESW